MMKLRNAVVLMLAVATLAGCQSQPFKPAGRPEGGPTFFGAAGLGGGGRGGRLGGGRGGRLGGGMGGRLGGGMGGGEGYVLPPEQMLLEPGPGVGGPGPGVMATGPVNYNIPQDSQVFFAGPDGMVVNWSISTPGMFDSEPHVAPASANFPQAAIYRLKLTNIPGRAGAELYPTLEVGPGTPRTEAYLAHNQIPVMFTEEDFDQVLSGNFVTKVIYLPDPEFQQLAIAGVDVLVSTRVDPGFDPIEEADRRGTILGIIRLGNKDLQLPGGFGGEGIQQVGYNQPNPVTGPGGLGAPVSSYGPMNTVPSHISGVTMPQYGMPYVGTPIGLPGPPHIPLGVPAGLRKHSITNHTKVHMPRPTKHFRVDVKHEPGLSYPRPVHKVKIHEQVVPPMMGP